TDLAAAVKASGHPLAKLVRRGLAAGTTEAAQPTPSPAGPSLAALPDGEPAHGAICMTPDAGNATPASTASTSSRSAPPATHSNRTHQREIPRRLTRPPPRRRLTAPARHAALALTAAIYGGLSLAGIVKQLM